MSFHGSDTPNTSYQGGGSLVDQDHTTRVAHDEQVHIITPRSSNRMPAAHTMWKPDTCPSFLELASEAIGTFTFIWLSLMNVSTATLYQASGVNMGWEGVAMSWTFNLWIAIKIASQHSLAMLNPCVAVAKWLEGVCFNSIGIDDTPFSARRLVGYVFVEIVAGTAAAAAVYGMNYGAWATPIQCGAFATTRSVNMAPALAVEFVGTALLMLGIQTVTRPGVCGQQPRHQAFKIALTLGGLVLAMGAQTAFSFNTARDMGPRLFVTIIDSNCWDGEYAFSLVAADTLGAITGMLISRLH